MLGGGYYDECNNVPSNLGTCTQVAAGLYNTIAIKTDGTVACWGKNDVGQCDVPANLGPCLQVAAGENHMVALKADGTVACWGSNYYGQGDVPANLGPCLQVAAGYSHTIALRTDGTLVCWGYNPYGQCNVPANLGPCIQIAGGGFFTVALKADGTVACWGLNGDGQCDVPAPNAGFVAIAAGGYHSMGIRAAEPPSLTLEAASCQDDINPGSAGYQMSVALWARDLSGPVSAFQSFLAFDTARLQFRSDLSAYADAVFDAHLTPIGTAEGPAGLLKLDGNTIAPGGPESTTADTLLATLVFDVVMECDTTANTIEFVPYLVFASELSFDGVPIPAELVKLPTITLDDTPPVVTCPTDVTVAADAGGCTALVAVAATATDNCDPSPTVACTRGDMMPLGAPYPSGTTTVTCTASDDCGNVSMCSFAVTVMPVNDMQVTVDLPGSAPAARCIGFLAHDGCDSVGINATLTFVDNDSNPATPVRAVATIQVPCGTWTSLCAKDEQHTKWADPASPLVVSGTHFVATSALTLKPGDDDNDGDVDINDVTWLIATFGDPATPGCDGAPRDGDFSNNGAIGSEDYSTLSGQWLTFSTCPACPPPIAGPPQTLDRRTAILAAELAPQLRRADLDRNGVFDWRDAAIFERRHGLDPSLSRRLRTAR